MRRLALVALLVAIAAGCGDDDAAATDAGSDASRPRDGGLPPPESCVQPGDVGNERGIGAYCSPQGHECRAYPLATLCLADVTPENGQWFCTRLCSDDSACGEGARCYGNDLGAACVPLRCLDEEDAGAGDGGVDDGGMDDAAVEDASADDAGEMDASGGDGGG